MERKCECPGASPQRAARAPQHQSPGTVEQLGEQRPPSRGDHRGAEHMIRVVDRAQLLSEMLCGGILRGERSGAIMLQTIAAPAQRIERGDAHDVDLHLGDHTTRRRHGQRDREDLRMPDSRDPDRIHAHGVGGFARAAGGPAESRSPVATRGAAMRGDRGLRVA